jgi:hypothetical protein
VRYKLISKLAVAGQLLRGRLFGTRVRTARDGPDQEVVSEDDKIGRLPPKKLRSSAGDHKL